jgi:hypothetical protein
MTHQSVEERTARLFQGDGTASGRAQVCEQREERVVLGLTLTQSEQF